MSSPWKPIESYRSSSFDPNEVWVRAEGHKPVLASLGFEEEHYDGWSDAWHGEDGYTLLDFVPKEWCELHEYDPKEG